MIISRGGIAPSQSIWGYALMERRVRGNSHARCGVGENLEIASKGYLSLYWEVLVGNCDSQIFLGGADQTTLEYISKRLGKETIRSINNSRSYGRQGSHSMSYNKTGRELMTADELAVMDNNDCIIFIRGLYPFYSKKYPLEDHPNYGRSGDGNRELFFDVKSLLTTGENVKSLEIKESMNLKIYKDAQIADTREGDRQYKMNHRPVQMTSANGRRLHVTRPLTSEIPHIHMRPEERTEEQQAELENTMRMIAIEKVVEPSAEDFMSYQQSIHDAMYGGPDELGGPESEAPAGSSAESLQLGET